MGNFYRVQISWGKIRAIQCFSTNLKELSREKASYVLTYG